MMAQPGKRAELLAILTEGTGQMPGNIAYLIGEDSANPDAIWIVELWDSKEAHAASLKLPAVQAAIGKGRPLIAGFGTRAEFTTVAKTGASQKTTRWPWPLVPPRGDAWTSKQHQKARATNHSQHPSPLPDS